MARERSLVLLAAPTLTMAACQPRSLYSGGGLTILSQNLLDAAPNNGAAAILVSQPSTHAAAKSSCTLLRESLWDPTTQDFNSALSTSLGYQTFLDLAPAGQLYWVSKHDNIANVCTSIDAQGNTHDLPCTTLLPALCTQSAPTSNSSFADNAVKWQVNHQVDAVTFTGYRDLHTFKFRGIRYADRPQRFTYSSPMLLDIPANVSAVTAGADCVQPIGEVQSGSSEDCLFMNIWTPTLPSTPTASQLKPVMLYLYGGGFQSGSGKNPNTDGTNLASRGDVVVISINYRVGSPGFLAFDDGVHKGNYAVSDMVAALEWVQKYVGHFGGDKERVTIFGESAGAMAVHLLLASPKAKGLFHRAIMQSDPDGYPAGGKLRWSQYADVEDEYKGTTSKVLKAVGCAGAVDEVECIKKIDGFELVNLGTNANGVTVDGVYITHHELDLTAPSYAAGVEVMTGTNRDETGVQIGNYPTNGTNFTSFIASNIGQNDFGSLVNYVASLPQELFGIPANTTGTPEQVFNASVRFATDGIFSCFDLAKAYAGAKNKAFKSTYSFQFNRTYSPNGYTQPWCNAPKTDTHPNGNPDQEYYKCHAAEQMIVFGTALRAGQPDRDGLDVPFMQLVVDYWASFAWTGDPNPEKGWLAARDHLGTLAQVEATGRWEQVDGSNPTLRLLQWNGKQVPFVEGKQCAALGVPLDILA